MSIELVMPSNHLILCHPLLLLPSIFPNIRVFSNQSAFCIRWPKYWSFSFSISPSKEYSGLISFRVEWLNLLAVQRILNRLLQHHSSKTSILLHSGPVLFLLSNLDYFYYFSCLNAVTRTSNTKLNKSDKSGYNCLFTYIRGDTFKVFTVKYYIHCGLTIMIFIMVRHVSSYTHCIQFLMSVNTEFCQKLFLHLLRLSFDLYTSIC